ncbi:MAG: phosphopentomutase [Clostridia bacterium]|nr:phosphopentomutase [Clostridia bacterium]
MKRRVFIIVLDSLGAGRMPDAPLFGDGDCNTLRRISSSPEFSFHSMKKMGMGNIDGVDYLPAAAPPQAAVCRLAERSAGKDTTIGHWEIAGVVSPSPLPTYPHGFPDEVIEEFRRKTGREVLCNRPYSGTDVIRDYGEEHLRTGALIVYTSADSVFQIAAHEELVPPEKLYEYCRIARGILTGRHAVGRVIARPFVGEPGNFTRTTNRHDFSLEPPEETLLDALMAEGRDVISVGKIYDIFAGRGVTESNFTHGNAEGMEKALEIADRDFDGLCFVNLVDFDMLYGHRQDVDGYARAFAAFDEFLPEFTARMRDDDILFITADHGCDPGDEHTDHTREYVPLIIFGKSIKPVNLGTRAGFCDIAATAAEALGISYRGAGRSFLKTVLRPTETELALCRAALEGRRRAYVPYSGFSVGAALLTPSGKIYSGCNIENAAFTPTNCAERTALFKAVSDGEREFTMLAVCSGKGERADAGFPPCGVCRQALSEFCAPGMPVLIMKNDEEFERTTFSELLPDSFTSDFMK